MPRRNSSSDSYGLRPRSYTEDFRLTEEKGRSPIKDQEGSGQHHSPGLRRYPDAEGAERRKQEVDRPRCAAGPIGPARRHCLLRLVSGLRRVVLYYRRRDCGGWRFDRYRWLILRIYDLRFRLACVVPRHAEPFNRQS